MSTQQQDRFRGTSPDGADLRALPVSVALLKDQLRIEWDNTDSDRLLDVCIRMAVDEVERYIESPIINRDYVMTFTTWPDAIEISNWPLVSLTSIEYYDSNNVLQTLAAADYSLSLDKATPTISPASSWPAVYGRADAIIVKYQAGWADSADNVPPLLRGAVMMRAATRFEMPVESGTGTVAWSIGSDLGLKDMLHPFKKVRA